MPRALHQLALALLPFLVMAVYRPAVKLELDGADYGWVQQGHAALTQPALLLHDLERSFRPALVASLAGDRLLWGAVAGGYHLTSLALHLLAVALLLLAGQRLGLRPVAALAVAVLWAVSTASQDPAVTIARRHETLLFLAWLGLILVWPDPLAAWSRRRVAAASALVLLAAASSEAWVVTPGLALALERFERRATWRQALLAASPIAAAVALYAALGVLSFFPSLAGIDVGALVLRRLLGLPHLLARLLHLEPSLPIGLPSTLAGLAAALAVAAAAWLGLRRQHPAAVVGLALLLLPLLAAVAVPHLEVVPVAIAYAGLLLLAATVIAAGLEQRTAGRRQAAAAALLIAAALLLATDVAAVRRELGRAALRSALQRFRLDRLQEAARSLPLGRPFLAVGEPAAPAPVGLGAQLDWVLGAGATVVATGAEEPLAGPAGAVLREEGEGPTWGFAWRAEPDLAAAAARFRAAGHPVELLVARPAQ